MSVQFGRWNFDGKPVDPDYLDKVKSVVAPYGPDDGGFYTKSGFSILYSAFHTSKESRRTMQPHLSASGTVITWDGRLDNRADLIRELRDVVAIGATDIELVEAAHERWGTDCLARLIGDWALVIWNPNGRSLLLAKDFAGIRPLFYTIDNQGVTWSTILDPLVLFAGKAFALCEEYIAGYLAFFPAVHLTPYLGIHSVPPSSYVLLRPSLKSVKKYWDFDPGKAIRYQNDTQYEEHFRTVFAESVKRRLRSDAPVLAELSGGMDSSSIVCMADTIIQRGLAEVPRLDTVSYFNDAEPNWDERPYFTKVEDRRGRTGCHIDVSSQTSLLFHADNDRFAASPGSLGCPDEAGRQLAACMNSQGNRVVLSGIGGDEVTGGVPTPIPELADLLARFRFKALARQLKAWALYRRQPWFYLLLEAARGFFPPVLVGTPRHLRPAPWLRSDCVRRNRAAFAGYETRLRALGPLPHVQQCLSTLAVLQRQIACDPIPSEPSYEKRYPYLDRDLLEFIFAIPREQLVRPGQRRSLMRRALVGIVPAEVLNRKRKAFIARAPLAAVSAHWASLAELSQCMISASLGLVDTETLGKALQPARDGKEILIVPLMRTLAVEKWLRTLSCRKILAGTQIFGPQRSVNTWSAHRPADVFRS